MLAQQRNNLYRSDTPTVPKDREAKPEEKFSSLRYPGFEAGKVIDKVFFPINEREDTNYTAFKAKHKI